MARVGWRKATQDTVQEAEAETAPLTTERIEPQRHALGDPPPSATPACSEHPVNSYQGFTH